MGFRLEKSRARDKRSLTFGTYKIVNIVTDAVIQAIDDDTAGQSDGLSIDDVESFIDEYDFRSRETREWLVSNKVRLP